MTFICLFWFFCSSKFWLILLLLSFKHKDVFSLLLSNILLLLILYPFSLLFLLAILLSMLDIFLLFVKSFFWSFISLTIRLNFLSLLLIFSINIFLFSEILKIFSNFLRHKGACNSLKILSSNVSEFLYLFIGKRKLKDFSW